MTTTKLQTAREKVKAWDAYVHLIFRILQENDYEFRWEITYWPDPVIYIIYDKSEKQI